MANKNNLKPIRSKNEAREKGKKGGIKSGEVRRKRKAMKEQMEMLLTLPFKQKKQLKFIKDLGVEDENIDNQMALIVAMYGKALKGDVQSFNIIKEITENNNITNSNNRIEIINDLPKENKNEN